MPVWTVTFEKRLEIHVEAETRGDAMQAAENTKDELDWGAWDIDDWEVFVSHEPCDDEPDHGIKDNEIHNIVDCRVE